MQVLPTEIITEIFSYLDIMELKKMEISKKIKKIVRKNRWEKITVHSLQIDKTIQIINNYSFIKYCLPRNTTDENIKLFKNCHTLDLSHCNNITDDGIKLLKNCHSLHLSYCNNITDKSIKELKCHTLNLNGCYKITDESVKNLKIVIHLILVVAIK